MYDPATTEKNHGSASEKEVLTGTEDENWLRIVELGIYDIAHAGNM